MRSKQEYDAAQVRSLRSQARAFELLAQGERDHAKRGALLRERGKAIRRADRLAQKMEGRR